MYLFGRDTIPLIARSNICNQLLGTDIWITCNSSKQNVLKNIGKLLEWKEHLNNQALGDRNQGHPRPKCGHLLRACLLDDTTPEYFWSSFPSLKTQFLEESLMSACSGVRVRGMWMGSSEGQSSWTSWGVGRVVPPKKERGFYQKMGRNARPVWLSG